MSNQIACPNCGHQLDIDTVLKHNIEEEYKVKYNKKWTELLEKRKQEEEQKNKELELKQQLLLQKEEDLKNIEKKNSEVLEKKLEEQKSELLKKVKKEQEEKVAEEFEQMKKLLYEQKLKLDESRKKEMEFMNKMQELKNKEEELELTVQKKMLQEREKLKEDLQKIEQEKIALKESEFLLRLKEKDKQLEDQKLLINEMKRKAEQGSMQLQGEIQELELEALLKNAFPFDIIEEVGKGVKGADAIHQVRNQLGLNCGKIIYESKRTKSFQKEWIEKLKTDMQTQNADIAVLVSEVLPKEIGKYGMINGIWICSFTEIKALSFVLRDSLLRISQAVKSQENKGEKMQMLYDYLNSNEFRMQMEAIIYGFKQLKDGITKERVSMEKIWKEREKQIDKVLINAAQFYGSVQGIAGSLPNYELFENSDTPKQIE